jgi:hypothetical protein
MELGRTKGICGWRRRLVLPCQSLDRRRRRWSGSPSRRVPAWYGVRPEVPTPAGWRRTPPRFPSPSPNNATRPTAPRPGRRRNRDPDPPSVQAPSDWRRGLRRWFRSDRPVSIVLTEPPPPDPSISLMIGMRNSVASCSDILGLPLSDASADPPRGVKSSPAITTGRPSTVPRPKTQLPGDVAFVVVGRLARDAADFLECAETEHSGDPFPHRQAAAFVLPLHPLRPAHLACEGLPLAKFGEFLLPAIGTGLGGFCPAAFAACCRRSSVTCPWFLTWP